MRRIILLAPKVDSEVHFVTLFPGPSTSIVDIITLTIFSARLVIPMRRSIPNIFIFEVLMSRENSGVCGLMGSPKIAVNFPTPANFSGLSPTLARGRSQKYSYSTAAMTPRRIHRETGTLDNVFTVRSTHHLPGLSSVLSTHYSNPWISSAQKTISTFIRNE